MDRPAPFMPHPDHVAYLANLLTVLAVFVGAYLIIRADRRHKRTAGAEPRTSWGPIS